MYVFHYKENNEYKTFELSGEEYVNYDDLKRRALGKKADFEEVDNSEIPIEWREKNEHR